MKKVFKYMGWCEKELACIHYDCFDENDNCKLSQYHICGGNDMVLAINAMRDRGDWLRFYRYVKRKCGFDWDDKLSVWLFGNPQRFFELMEAWMNEKAD